MTLTSLQSKVLRILAAHRDPESYVAGSIPIHDLTSRRSEDIDIFHDREERIFQAVQEDSAILQAEGFELNWLRREPLIYTAEVIQSGESTRLEWVVDSDFRFFPTLDDETFGYVLHPVDIATNKVMAAAGRRKPHDLVDLLTIHEYILPLGAVIWAAVEKSPGFTPEGLIAEIRRISNYRPEELAAVPTDKPIEPLEFYTRLREILQDAEDFVLQMPTEKIGLLFLKDGEIVQPDPKRLDDYHTHAGKRRGHWPTSSEIMSEMLEMHKGKG